MHWAFNYLGIGSQELPGAKGKNSCLSRSTWRQCI